MVPPVCVKKKWAAMRSPISLLVVVVGGFLAACNSGMSTAELLSAKLVTTDGSAPSFVSPADRALIVNSGTVAPVTLSWSSRASAGKYIVEIYTDSALQTAYPCDNCTTTQTQVSLTLPAEKSYWWRVKSIAPTVSAYSATASFSVLTDTLYVNCAGTESCNKDYQLGSLNQPFQSVKAAADFAAINNQQDKSGKIIKTIKVATRGSGASYNEYFNVPNGVSVLGAYTADFSETNRNVTSNKTSITTELYSYPITAAAITSATTIEGFISTGTSVGVSAGLYLMASNSNLIIKNNTFIGGNASGRSYGALILSSNGTQISNNTFTGGNTTAGTYTYGAFLIQSSPVLTNNTFTGGNATGDTFGIYVDVSSAPSATNNTITGGTGLGTSTYSSGVLIEVGGGTYTNNTITGGVVQGSSGFSFGVRSYSGTSGTFQLNIITTLDTTTGGARTRGIYAAGAQAFTNNVIKAGNSTTASSIGVYANASSGAVFTNNTIASGTTTTGVPYGLDVETSNSAASLQFSNNIIFSMGSAATRYAGYEDGRVNPSSTDPSGISTNIFFDVTGTPTAYYHDTTGPGYPGTTSDIVTVCAANFGSGCGTAISGGTVSGNISGGSTATIFAAGYSVSNLTTWVIKTSGPADINNPGGGWSSGDIGANAAACGRQ